MISDKTKRKEVLSFLNRGLALREEQIRLSRLYNAAKERFFGIYPDVSEMRRLGDEIINVKTKLIKLDREFRQAGLNKLQITVVSDFIDGEGVKRERVKSLYDLVSSYRYLRGRKLRVSVDPFQPSDLIPVGAIFKSAFKACASATAARVSKGAGLIDDGANYAQKTFSETFSEGGKFAGKSIDDVAGLLRRGKLKPNDVPIEFFTRSNGQQILLNTRSAEALRRAGIPRSKWIGKKISGDIDALRRLSKQLKGNRL